MYPETSPLCHAVDNGNPGMVAALLDAKATVDADALYAAMTADDGAPMENLLRPALTQA